MRPVERILSSLDKVRKRGPDSWMACCPAHEDKNPSLSIKETKDGDVLLHCFAGCGVDDVLAAIGLEMSDLFKKPVTMVAPSRHVFTAEDVLVALVDELEDLCNRLADGSNRPLELEATYARFADALDFIKGLS